MAELERNQVLLHPQERHLKHLETLTAQQLAIATGGAALVASAMLSHGNKLGFLFLALAAACAVGAFAKRHQR